MYLAIKFSTSILQSKKSMQIGDKNSVIGGNVFPLIINSAIKINVPDKKIMVKINFPYKVFMKVFFINCGYALCYKETIMPCLTS